MAVRSTVVTVTTSRAVVLDGSDYVNDDPLVAILRNDSGSTIYIGGDDVTTANGMAILTATSVPLEVYAGDEVYAIAGSSLALQVFKQRSL